jgi:acyl carrier protein
MTKEKIYEELTTIFRDTFMDDTIELSPSTFADDIEDWDSLMQMVLLSEVEKKFKFKFSAKEASGMQNVGEMVDIIMASSAGQRR